MALVLSYSIAERNDNLVITLTDDTDTYHAVDNPGGWETGAATNPDPADIDDISHTLALLLQMVQKLFTTM